MIHFALPVGASLAELEYLLFVYAIPRLKHIWKYLYFNFLFITRHSGWYDLFFVCTKVRVLKWISLDGVIWHGNLKYMLIKNYLSYQWKRGCFLWKLLSQWMLLDKILLPSFKWKNLAFRNEIFDVYCLSLSIYKIMYATNNAHMDNKELLRLVKKIIGIRLWHLNLRCSFIPNKTCYCNINNYLSFSLLKKFTKF